MDCTKVGNLILTLRKEKNMTQKMLADMMNISDRTISKWERGIGCPDVSLLQQLSDILGVDIEKILTGELSPNDVCGGNMKRIKFYICPTCKNTVFSLNYIQISCCGRKLEPLPEHEADADHEMTVSKVDDELYVTFNHEMTKEHYISFVAYHCSDRVLFIKLYPEQDPYVRLSEMPRGIIYYCCNQHKLMKAFYVDKLPKKVI